MAERPSIERALYELRHPSKARFRGMVDTRVRVEDFECDPERPNPISCPSSGCRHCVPIALAADPPGRCIDTEETIDG